MGKLGCICGSTIVDQADNLPYKGYIIPDTEIESTSDILSDTIDSLSDATKQSKRLDWIKEKIYSSALPHRFK